MNRSAGVVGAGVLLAAFFAALVLLVMFFGADDAPAPFAARPTSPTPEVVEGPPIDLEELAWAYVPEQRPGEIVRSYGLQAGTLAHDEPLVDLAVEWQADLNADLGRQPAVGPPVDGAVVYVADDGLRSAVHRLQIARDGRDEVRAEIDDLVWDIVVAPDGLTAYAALIERGTRRDLGVVRMLLDGSGSVEQLMPPAPITAAGETMPVAVMAFNVELALSADGRHLVRRSCEGVEGCAIDVLDLTTGVIRPIREDVVGVAADVVVTRRCFEVCELLATHLVTGGTILFDDELVGAVIAHHGRPLLVSTVEAEGRISIEAVDLSNGRRQLLHRGPPDGQLSFGLDRALLLTVPPGYVHATESVPIGEQGAVVELRTRELLISVENGQVIEVPRAPFRPPGFGHQD